MMSMNRGMSKTPDSAPVATSRRDFAPEELMELFQSFQKSMFRLETLDAYSVASDAILPLYLAGDPLPPPPNKYQLEWWGIIEEASKQEKDVSRVHVVPNELTPYLRYEIDWGYAYSAQHGEKIFLVSREDNKRLADIAAEDFYLFDDKTLVYVKYDESGSHLGYELEQNPECVEACVKIKADLISAALPLNEYLAKVRNRQPF
jgi:hypothetical protein